MTKEVKVGLLAIISGAILYLGFNFLKGKNFFSPTNTFFAVYKNIDGLNVSNPVIINGYAVGRVSSIGILQDQGNKIFIEMHVNDDVILGSKTVATLTNSDFLGSKAILLDIGDVSVPIESGDTIISAVDKGLAAVLENAKPITANLGITLTRINEILLGMEGAGEEIKNAIHSLDATLISVNAFVGQNNTKVKATFDEVNTLLGNINRKVDKIDPLLDNANSTLSGINKLPLDSTINALNITLQEVAKLMASINDGQGTVGKLMSNDSLYNNMNQTMIDLDKLLIHFDENPKHFLAPLGKSKEKIAKDRQK